MIIDGFTLSIAFYTLGNINSRHQTEDFADTENFADKRVKMICFPDLLNTYA